MSFELKRADVSGYEISASEYEILKRLRARKKRYSSAEFGGLEVHNLQPVPNIYLTPEDHEAIYDKVVRDVLADL